MIKHHFLFDVLEWAEKRPEGFNYSGLTSLREFKEWEVKILENYLKIAHENDGRSRDFRSPLLSETIFFVVKAESGNFKEDRNLYTLTTDALFKFIDYKELKFARENAKEARRLSMYAIGLSVLAIVISAIVPFLVAKYVTQTVEILK